MGFVLEEDAERLEQELAQACLERDSARNVLARAIEHERLANMRATEWEEARDAAQEVANRETLSAAYWKDKAAEQERMYAEVSKALEELAAQVFAGSATGRWREVSDVVERQVAWIDRDARHVAVVVKGREFILTLPILPADNRTKA
jgi:hypothetical protein